MGRRHFVNSRPGLLIAGIEKSRAIEVGEFAPGDVQINPDPQSRDSAGADGMRVPFSDVTSYLFVLQVPYGKWQNVPLSVRC
jgi:hypothetical protein